jgi:hypothetical protein
MYEETFARITSLCTHLDESHTSCFASNAGTPGSCKSNWLGSRWVLCDTDLIVPVEQLGAISRVRLWFEGE